MFGQRAAPAGGAIAVSPLPARAGGQVEVSEQNSPSLQPHIPASRRAGWHRAPGSAGL